MTDLAMISMMCMHLEEDDDFDSDFEDEYDLDEDNEFLMIAL